VKDPEPFTKLVHQGMMLGLAYRYYVVVNAEGGVVRALDGDDAIVAYDRESGKHFVQTTREPVEARWLGPTEVRKDGDAAYHPEYGVKLFPVTEKMSKSRGNVINPDQVVEEFGADALRVYEMFMGPLDSVKPWQTAGIQGVRRFLDRVHALATKQQPSELSPETRKQMHRTVKKVTEDIEALRYNTAISAMMIFVNHLAQLPEVPKEAVEKLVLCLSPFAPHLAEELWLELGHEGSLAHAPWPDFDPKECVDDVVEIAVQVNGKVRGAVTLARDATEEAAREAALQDDNVQKHIEGKAIRKVVYVPGRILNIIVG
jgi:leucyl-tRNA synthetase